MTVHLKSDVLVARTVGWLFVGIVALNVTGCTVNSSGGGSTHLVPTVAKTGEPIKLTVNFVATGQRAGNLAERYTNLRCLFMVNDSKQSSEVLGTVVSSTADPMNVDFELSTDGCFVNDAIAYRFEFDFDGRVNTRPGGIVVLSER